MPKTNWMRLPQLTGFFRHLPGSTSRSVFIRITKPYTPLTDLPVFVCS